MIESWLGILLVVLILALMSATLKVLEHFFHPHPEIIRKLFHVGMGLVVISFPWLFREQWPIVLLSLASAILFAVIKLTPRLRDGVGTVLTGVHRVSIGEVCFPVAVGALAVLYRGNTLLFVVPMLIMTLADAVAALVGIAYGKVRYVTSDGFKSAEGSIAFLSIAFLSVHVPLLLCTGIGRAQTLLIAMIVALLSMMIEAMASRGLDNLLIPLGAFGFLRLYEHATPQALVLRLAATVILLVFVLPWRRRTSLTDSGLIASALYGYGAAMLGGPAWMVGPLCLFLVHLLFWPRFGPRREHSVDAVVSVTLAGLLWLGLQVAYGGVARFYFPYAIGFGAHLALISVSRIAVDPSSRPRVLRLANAILAGAALTALQMLVLLCCTTARMSTAGMLLAALAGVCSVAIGAVAFYLLLPVLYGKRGSDGLIHIAGFTCALLSSILAAGLWHVIAISN